MLFEIFNFNLIGFKLSTVIHVHTLSFFYKVIIILCVNTISFCLIYKALFLTLSFSACLF